DWGFLPPRTSSLLAISRPRAAQSHHAALNADHSVILRRMRITPSSCAERRSLRHPAPNADHSVILRRAQITPSSCAAHGSLRHPARSEAESQDPSVTVLWIPRLRAE